MRTEPETFEEMKARYQQEMLQYTKAKTVSPAQPGETPPTKEPSPSPGASDSRPSGQELSRPEEGPEQDRELRDTGYGTMIVRVYTAREALPVYDALVLISRDLGGQITLHRMTRTDISGNTEEIRLPAPPAELSEEPGNTDPFAAYTIQVSKPGYYTAEYRQVPVFACITSVQPVELMPLPERESLTQEEIVIDEQLPREALP